MLANKNMFPPRCVLGWNIGNGVLDDVGNKAFYDQGSEYGGQGGWLADQQEGEGLGSVQLDVEPALLQGSMHVTGFSRGEANGLQMAILLSWIYL